MMKWKTRTETTNIGILELSDVIFDSDYLEISIDICDMSDDLKEKVKNLIEIKKKEYTKKTTKSNKEYGTHFNTIWSDKPIIMDFTYLRIILKAGEAIDYSLEFGFSDAEDKDMNQWDCSIAVDLSEYLNELKKSIIKALIDKFF